MCIRDSCLPRGLVKNEYFADVKGNIKSVALSRDCMWPAFGPHTSRSDQPCRADQKINFAPNQIWRSPPVPVPRPARFKVEVITPNVAVLVTSVPGLLR